MDSLRPDTRDALRRLKIARDDGTIRDADDKIIGRAPSKAQVRALILRDLARLQERKLAPKEGVPFRQLDPEEAHPITAERYYTRGLSVAQNAQKLADSRLDGFGQPRDFPLADLAERIDALHDKLLRVQSDPHYSVTEWEHHAMLRRFDALVAEYRDRHLALRERDPDDRWPEGTFIELPDGRFATTSSDVLAVQRVERLNAMRERQRQAAEREAKAWIRVDPSKQQRAKLIVARHSQDYQRQRILTALGRLGHPTDFRRLRKEQRHWLTRHTYAFAIECLNRRLADSGLPTV